jgi:choline dehydrogenase-like flavoprotein
MYPHHALRIPGYGADFKAQVRRMQTGYLYFGWFGKVLARPENRVTVDANQRDAYGIPIAVVRFRFGENDLALWSDSLQSVSEICHRIKGQAFLDRGAPGGFASHEVGTVRMGNDPRRSALNGYCQAHEVKNLFVTDGSTFTTSSEKNPTLTIMALSLRAADYIKDQRRKGEL